MYYWGKKLKQKQSAPSNGHSYHYWNKLGSLPFASNNTCASNSMDFLDKRQIETEMMGERREKEREREV